MTTLTTARPVPSSRQQWWVLTSRLITPSLRNGEVAVGVVDGLAGSPEEQLALALRDPAG